ncbi:hypothetical protein AVEN_245837-1 [Araneus ventricosus]|uniref:Uncharacterized protein n=1 Tax=Araneus ventricosus TaxID=182803 RepID=A0A4Y2E8E0_ARAVE|nr:hypothetical protein AVEN_245837-1 [Araneus ventricosus]
MSERAKINATKRSHHRRQLLEKISLHSYLAPSDFLFRNKHLECLHFITGDHWCQSIKPSLAQGRTEGSAKLAPANGADGGRKLPFKKTYIRIQIGTTTYANKKNLRINLRDLLNFMK